MNVGQANGLNNFKYYFYAPKEADTPNASQVSTGHHDHSLSYAHFFLYLKKILDKPNLISGSLKFCQNSAGKGSKGC